jgi:hypothetical protein
MKQRIVKAAKAIKGKAVAIGSTLSMVAMAPAAFAQDSIGATVKAAVDGYKEEALIAIMAMIVVLWTLKATGVLKPR